MKHRWPKRTAKPLLALGLAVAPWVAAAQGQDAGVQDWRTANQTVGRYPRGHADVLRAEKTPMATAANAQNAVPAFALASVSEAVHAAWNTHRKLASPLARLGRQNVQRIADGDWATLDPSLQRRIEGVDDVLAVAARTRKAWIAAVAARQTLASLEDAVTAAEAATELGRRMVGVGNWSPYQQAQVALGESAAHIALQRARLAASQAERALLQAVGLDTTHDRVALPDRLPDAPTVPIDESELHRRLAAIQSNLPTAQSRRAGSDALQAYAAYTAGIALHGQYRNEVLQQRERIGQETQLRYNGMLASVWDLLADVGARSQAVVAAIGAQRDALIAETDLHWVLQGGHPDAFVSLGGGERAATAAAAH